MGGPWKKTDNHPAGLKAKIDLRQRVLSEVSPANVFDGFCGTGEMYRGAWQAAASYVGCDTRAWSQLHPPRFVADNVRLMRNLDLSAFNVFDFDAYGSPWPQLECLLHRRTWKPGERGAVVITDGTSLKLRWGGMPAAMTRIAGVSQAVPQVAAGLELQQLAMVRWIEKAKIKTLKSWQARGRPPANVVYTAIVFEGGSSA